MKRLRSGRKVDCPPAGGGTLWHDQPWFSARCTPSEGTLNLDFCPGTTSSSFGLGSVPFLSRHLWKKQARPSSNSFTSPPFWDLHGGFRLFPVLSRSFYLFPMVHREGQECSCFLSVGDMQGIRCACLVTQCLSSGMPAAGLPPPLPSKPC